MPIQLRRTRRPGSVHDHVRLGRYLPVGSPGCGAISRIPCRGQEARW